MTIGFWTDRARDGLRAATTAMRGRDAVHADAALGVVHARHDVYRGLARLTELLTGARPDRGDLTVPVADVIMRGHGNHLNRLHVGLYAATVLDGRAYPAAAAPRTQVETQLRIAADAIGVVGDILATHIPPGQRPRTQEGVAIRAGGGVRAALADVARLTRDALDLDGKLPAWLTRADPHELQRFDPVADAARWATGSRLRAVAHQVSSAGAGAEPLLRLLDTAAVPGDAPPAVETADGAVAALAAARTWLWQHPQQIQVAHLQLGTQLGLAVHTVAGECAPGDPVVQLRAWRQAAIAAADLHGAPTVGDGRAAAAELAETLRWARDRLHPRHDGPAAQRVEELARLHGDLPLLAEALGRGLPHTVARGELFASEPELRKPPGKVIFYARTTWTPLTRPDATTCALARAFAALEPLGDRNALQALPARAAPRAAQAFPGPVRPSAAPGQNSPGGPVPGQPQDRPHGRGR